MFIGLWVYGFMGLWVYMLVFVWYFTKFYKFIDFIAL